MATITSSTLFRSVVYISVVVASMTFCCVEGLALNYTTYMDTECMEPMTSILTFGDVYMSENSTTMREFNECVEEKYGSAWEIMVCNEATGEYGFQSYTDAECTQLSSELIYPTTCSYGTTRTCSGEDPDSDSTEDVYYTAYEYTNDSCTDLTGSSRSGLYEVDNMCNNNGSMTLPFILKCREGNTIIQSFGLEDVTCSGDVWYQAESYPGSYCSGNETTGYYSVAECTTDSTGLDIIETSRTDDIITATTSGDDEDGDKVSTATADTPAPGAIGVTMTPTTGASATTDEVEAANGAGRTIYNSAAVGAAAIICGLGLIAEKILS